MSTARFSQAIRLLAIVIVLQTPIAARAAVIRLKPQCEVAAGVVRLGDVAEIDERDADRRQKLLDAALIPAPGPGRKETLSFTQIRARLHALGFPLSDLDFLGGSLVVVTGADAEANPTRPAAVANDTTQRRVEQWLEKMIARHVEERAPQLGRVATRVVLSREMAALLGMANTARCDVTGGIAPWVGDQMFTVTGFDRQGAKFELPVRGQVEPLPHIVKARLPIARGEVISAQALVLEQLEAPSEKADHLDRIELVAGSEARRSIRPGESLTSADIRTVPLVRRGEIVTVFARTAGITARMEAKSQGDAAMGQQVPLVTLDGKSRLVGTVTGFHEVAVLAAGGAGDEPTAAAPPRGIVFRNETIPPRANTSPSGTPQGNPPPGNTPVSGTMTEIPSRGATPFHSATPPVRSTATGTLSSPGSGTGEKPTPPASPAVSRFGSVTRPAANADRSPFRSDLRR